MHEANYATQLGPCVQDEYDYRDLPEIDRGDVDHSPLLTRIRTIKHWRQSPLSFFFFLVTLICRRWNPGLVERHHSLCKGGQFRHRWRTTKVKTDPPLRLVKIRNLNGSKHKLLVHNLVNLFP